MQKLFIDRQASDNKYLHYDFHTVLDQGLGYLGERYGENSVDDYLGRFALGFYAPLIADAKENAFPALCKHISGIYNTEESLQAVSFVETDNELRVAIAACPAITYMRGTGHNPSKWYVKTTSTVCSVIANALNLGFEMISYDEKTGQAEYRFYK